jgi:hypothetical protein
MGRGMSPGSHEKWMKPDAEAALIKAERTSWDWVKEVDKAGKSDRINGILNDLNVVDAIKDAGFPEDEGTCDRIGEKHGLGAAEIAVLSKRLRERTDPKTH